jgi:ribosomal protein S18 acetylase RimI-like enzyme
MEKIRITHAKKRELPLVANILNKSFKKHNILKQNHEKVINYLSSHKGLIVAKLNDKLVGTILYRKNGFWKINHLAVSKPYRNNGIGKSLVIEAEKRIAKIEKDAIIEVKTTEKTLFEFIKRLGYKQVGIFKNYYRKNEMAYAFIKKKMKNK